MWIAIGLLIAIGAAAMFMPRPENVDATRARLAHILIAIDKNDPGSRTAAIEEVRALREQILNGANFSKLAAQHSDDPLSAKNGGDLGWVHRGEMTEAVDNFIWTAPFNQVSEPIVTELGLHLIIVRERQLSKADLHEMQLKERVLNQQSPGETPAQ
jgi:parvulin-like peptidyl-prolyl isomerase